MSATVMSERIAEVSPDLDARVAGVFALLVGFALVARGDAADATAAAQSLFRSGLAAELIAVAGYVAVVPIFYGLFRPVSRGLSFIAAFVGVVGSVVLAVNTLNLFAPLLLLRSARYLNVPEVELPQALAQMFLELHGQGRIFSLAFFGLYCLLIGYLIFRSTFLPHILGVLMAIAGLCWLTDSLSSFLSPSLANDLHPYILVPGLLGEGLLCLWLLVMGLNKKRRNDNAKTSAANPRDLSSYPSRRWPGRGSAIQHVP